jgi:hypothetical protein
MVDSFCGAAPSLKVAFRWYAPRVCGFRFASMVRAARPAAGLFSRGHIYKLLSNPIYVGRIAHKDKSTKASIRRSSIKIFGIGSSKACAIISQPGTKRTRQSSEALLAGKLFDDRGNRMSPTWAKKGSKRWRYYVSQAVLRGDKSKAGSMVRVPTPRLKRWSLIIVAVRSEGRKSSQGKTRSGTFGARHVDTFQLKRRSASYWKGCGGGEIAELCRRKGIASSMYYGSDGGNRMTRSSTARRLSRRRRMAPVRTKAATRPGRPPRETAASWR